MKKPVSKIPVAAPAIASVAKGMLTVSPEKAVSNLLLFIQNSEASIRKHPSFSGSTGFKLDYNIKVWPHLTAIEDL